MNKISNLKYLALYLMLQLICSYGYSQQADISIHLATVDISTMSKKSMFDFQINVPTNAAGNVSIKGVLKYRNQPHYITYTLTIPMQPGVNNIAEHAHKARFEYSSNSLKELFEMFDKLPEGLIQYCVTVTRIGGEPNSGVIEDCIFGKNEDLFLINLIDPEDKAEIYELNPMLSWVANFPFASTLSYKIKVVEMKKDQNAVNAVKRNNSVFEEKGLMQMSLNYPIYAKPLQVGSTYAWTVDAFYKDLLLGGAEPWQFTIVENSLYVSVSRDPSYVDIDKESGVYKLNVPGILKLKYVLKDKNTDTLHFSLFSFDNKEIKLPEALKKSTAHLGDNRFELNLREHLDLKHLKHYYLNIENSLGKKYHIPFRYINPDFIK